MMIPILVMTISSWTHQQNAKQLHGETLPLFGKDFSLKSIHFLNLSFYLLSFSQSQLLSFAQSYLSIICQTVCVPLCQFSPNTKLSTQSFCGGATNQDSINLFSVNFVEICYPVRGGVGYPSIPLKIGYKKLMGEKLFCFF